MAATHKDISTWIERATDQHSHVIIVCDTFEHEDYPVFVKKSEDVRKVYEHYRTAEMSRVMEVYNLALPLNDQLAEPRAFNF